MTSKDQLVLLMQHFFVLLVRLLYSHDTICLLGRFSLGARQLLLGLISNKHCLIKYIVENNDASSLNIFSTVHEIFHDQIYPYLRCPRVKKKRKESSACSVYDLLPVFNIKKNFKFHIESISIHPNLMLYYNHKI